MKIILTILCGLMVLFAGGCAVIALAAGPLALLPGGVAALNIFVLIALYGSSKPAKWAFVTLIILDALWVLVLLMAWASGGFSDPLLNLWAAGFIGTVALKGALTFAMLRKLQ